MVTKKFLEFDSFKCFSIYMLKSIEKCSQLELANKCELSPSLFRLCLMSGTLQNSSKRSRPYSGRKM